MAFFEGVYRGIFTFLVQDLKKGVKNGPFSGFPGGGAGKPRKRVQNSSFIAKNFFGPFFGKFWGFLGFFWVTVIKRGVSICIAHN